MEAYTVCKECNTATDPFTLFRTVNRDAPHGVLLESRDGNGRNNVNSMLFVKSALRIIADGSTVTIQVLTPNGWDALRAMESRLKEMGTLEITGQEGVLVFSGDRPTGDDLTRIKAPYPSDVVRLFASGWNLGTEDASKRLVVPGVFSYDYLETFEKLPPAKTDLNRFPDFCFFLPEVVITVDHQRNTAMVAVHGYGKTSYTSGYQQDVQRADQVLQSIRDADKEGAAEISSFDGDIASLAPDVDLSDDEYGRTVAQMKEHIVKGDVFQIVPSRTFRMPCTDPLRVYGVLRQTNPSPYLFYMDTTDFTLLGSSPETSVKVTNNPRMVSICPIAGTRRRGYRPDGHLDKDLDSRLEAELKLNEKELAEHMMLVDLARNDVARVSKPGTRHVPQLLEITRYSQVMHLVSVVQGELRDDLDAVHAYLASANMGTLVGAPKIKAASLLRRYEVDKRGPYGGAVGYLSSDGEMDTAIVIRSALVTNGIAAVRAGAGVVYDSDPMAEAAETRAKAGAVLNAIALAQRSCAS